MGCLFLATINFQLQGYACTFDISAMLDRGIRIQERAGGMAEDAHTIHLSQD
jgi:hypothetical protein